MNCMKFSKGEEFIFGLTKKFFRVAQDDLDHVSMEGLGSKPLIIHLELAKYV